MSELVIEILIDNGEKKSYSTADCIFIQHNAVFMTHCNPRHSTSSEQHEYDYKPESKNDSKDHPSNRNVY